MSNEQKPVLNLYGILDSELSRMHSLLQAYLALPQHDNHGSSYGGMSHSNSFGSKRHDIPEIYKRILKIQDLLLEAIVAHDGLIQEKVAELALTGVKDETKV